MPANPLRRVTVRNIATHKLRLALSVLAVVLGTAFVTGSLVFTSTLQATFDRITTAGTEGVSAVVSAGERARAGVPIDSLDRLRSKPAVAKVEPEVSGTVVLLNPDGSAHQTGGAPSMGVEWVDPGSSIRDNGRIVDGRAPQAPGEIALNTSALGSAGLSVGEQARIYTSAEGTQSVTIVGAYELPSNTGGYVGVAFSAEQARALFTDGKTLSTVYVQAQPGASEETLAADLKAAYPELKVQTGTEFRDAQAEQLGTALSFVNYFFVAFGLVALLVGTFIIYNTFAMLVAQRLRELALLRAIGASRGQITRSVLGEAVLTGIIGSVIGVAVGFALAKGIFVALDAFGVGMPTGGLEMTASAVVAPLVLGLAVTVVSAWAPAYRAGRIPPVAAMRSGVVESETGGVARATLGTYLVVCGILLAVIGTWQDTTKVGAITVGVGAAALIIGAFLVMPALARPIAGGIGRIVGAPFGAVGKLAATNAGRNSRRTAATAFALTLGLTLLAAFGTVGATTKANVEGTISKGINADVVVMGFMSHGSPTPLPANLPDRLSAVPGVADVAWQSVAYGSVGGVQAPIRATGGTLGELVNGGNTEGSLVPETNSLVVSRAFSRSKGWVLGSSVPLVGPDGKERSLRVTGVYEDGPLLGDYYIGMDTYRQLVPENLQSSVIVLVKAKPGESADQLKGALQKELADLPIANVQDKDEYVASQAGSVDQVLAIIYALLGLALVIAVLGIVNTLALSVIERKSEIGMLRAVGMQRSQVRLTVNLESTQIAVFGAVVGAAMGVFLGWAFVRCLADQGLKVIAIPWSTIIAVLVASAFIGVLASLWPAHRAAKTDPLEAVAD